MKAYAYVTGLRSRILGVPALVGEFMTGDWEPIGREGVRAGKRSENCKTYHYDRKKELNVISIQQTTHGHMPPEQTSNFCHLFIKEPSLQLEALRL